MPTETLGPWPLPADLEALHDAVIEFALGVNGRVDAQFEKEASRGPLAYKALQRLHRTAMLFEDSPFGSCS